jgi:hypothetical protein
MNQLNQGWACLLTSSGKGKGIFPELNGSVLIGTGHFDRKWEEAFR